MKRARLWNYIVDLTARTCRFRGDAAGRIAFIFIVLSPVSRAYAEKPELTRE